MILFWTHFWNPVCSVSLPSWDGPKSLLAALLQILVGFWLRNGLQSGVQTGSRSGSVAISNEKPSNSEIKPPLQGEHDFLYYSCSKKPICPSKIHPKLVPKLVPKRDPFRNPLFSMFFVIEAVLRHLKTTCLANFKKNGPPFGHHFGSKSVKMERR